MSNGDVDAGGGLSKVLWLLLERHLEERLGELVQTRPHGLLPVDIMHIQRGDNFGGCLRLIRYLRKRIHYGQHPVVGSERVTVPALLFFGLVAGRIGDVRQSQAGARLGGQAVPEQVG